MCCAKANAHEKLRLDVGSLTEAIFWFSDKHTLWRTFKSMFGSSHSASSAYQK